MLVLTRKADESIQIGSGIKVMVVQAKNGRCRLGIEAPPDFRILRSEHVDSAECEPHSGSSNADPELVRGGSTINPQPGGEPRHESSSG